MKRSTYLIRALLIFMLGLCLGPQVVAQEVQPEEAVIYYKDGSIFKGFLVGDGPLHYRMVLSTLDTINVNKSMVGRLSSVNSMSVYRRGSFHYKEGMYIYVTGMLGGGDGHATALTDVTLGWRTTPQQSIGLGVGLAISDVTLANAWMTHEFTTLFAYGRQYLGKGKTRFYFDTRVGYGFARSSEFVGDEHNGGFHYQPGVGFHFASKSGLKWHIGLARFIQRTSGDDVTVGPFNQPIETNFKLWYSRTLFKIGIEIK